MSTQTRVYSDNIKRRSIKHWNKDSVNGGPTSIEILVTWLCKEGNYGRWRGGEAQGISKESLCSEIKAKMTENGITHRLNSDIRAKIQHLQEKYRDVLQFLNTTGQGLIEGMKANGVSEEDINAIMKGKVNSKFSYFHRLEPVMSDQTPISSDDSTSSQGERNVENSISRGGTAETENSEDEEEDEDEDEEDRQLRNEARIGTGTGTGAGTGREADAEVETEAYDDEEDDDEDDDDDEEEEVNGNNGGTQLKVPPKRQQSQPPQAQPQQAQQPQQDRSAVPPIRNDRPSKRVRRNVDTSISEILKKSAEMDKTRNIQFERHFAAEEAFRREQLRIQERQLALEEKRAISEQAQAQVNYAEMLKDLGLSNENILKKIKEMFK
ncbi:hypothetical protein J3Q64DRAFT_1766403 [Phycomyces blakesleeanus]|uniref:No apical meristem-associated C-terminal domain-containing protein n=1 Tax=Phycomyces blakesleeanus TaxID=4837 RepID=A0ABR3ARN6_PHYBL